MVEDALWMQCLFRNLPEEAPASHRRPGRRPLCFADDIMLYGVGCTDDEAIADHDTKLQALLQRCRDVGIRLNKSKIKLRQKSLTFLGHLVTDKGLKSDPEKVKAIAAMPPPTDMEGVQRLNGFVKYLAKFLPKLSETMEPIRQLMRNDVPWNWAAARQRAFEVKLKY